MSKLVYSEKELPQKSDKWLEIRKSCIGGSDISTILGLLAKYENPHNFFKRRTGKMGPKQMNAAMERGNLLEKQSHKSIKAALRKDFGIKSPKIEPCFALHPQYPYIGISFDGVDRKNKFITEIKCPSKPWKLREVFEDGIPDYYYPQVQLQLSVANAHWGITKAYFCSYYPEGANIIDYTTYTEEKKTLAIIDIDYDEEYGEAIIKIAKKYFNYIQYDHLDEEEYNSLIAEFNKRFYA